MIHVRLRLSFCQDTLREVRGGVKVSRRAGRLPVSRYGTSVKSQIGHTAGLSKHKVVVRLFCEITIVVGKIYDHFVC